MGYTHYFTTKKNITLNQMKSISNDFRKIVPKLDVKLLHEYDRPDTTPEISEDVIIFNGAGEDGHETFVLDRTTFDFSFCKTAQKPYDLAVTTCLVIAKHYLKGEIDISSDGGAEDWKQAIDICKKELKINDIEFTTNLITKGE